MAICTTGHFLEPKEFEVSVRFSNIGVQEAGRRVDFVHMPVPRTRSDEVYFAPLQDPAIGDATLHMGLVHHTDGIEGT
jgi:hypothetical protein